MRFTKTLAVLFALGMIFFVLSGRFPVLLMAGLIYDGLLAALVIADLLLTPQPVVLWEVQRYVDEKLALGTTNKVLVAVRYSDHSHEAVVRRVHGITVRDEPPPAFTVEGETTVRLALSPTEREAVFTYHLTPPAKGDFGFGDIYIYQPGLLGLIGRVGRMPAALNVKVYPNLHETEKYDMLVRRGRLMQVGIRNIRQRGGGSEFESLREYVPGDEYRKIDWAATARRGKLITRQYEMERAQNILIVIDTGRNMLQPIQKMAKLDYVINTALMLAYVAASSDDKVGLAVFDAEVRAFLPPAKSKSQVYQILSVLYNASAQMVESDYREAFKEIAARWRRRSLLVLFTDLVDPDSSAEIINDLAMLADLHRVVCVTVADPNITDAARAVPETAPEVYQKSVAMQVLQERRQAISILKRRGIWTVDSPPETLSADLINHYLELKSRSSI
jgi:uncharacterized protein (DUF58 family)